MKTTSTPRLRFAPSPNGPLHLGHAYSVLRNLDIAKKLQGDVVLRIDDIDQTRARKTHEDAIIKDCQWLGLDVQEPLRRQSRHVKEYKNAIEQLSAMGLTYNAYASRKDIRQFISEQKTPWPHDPDGAPLFPNIETFTTPSKAYPNPTSMRLNMRKALAFLGENAPKSFTKFDPESGEITSSTIHPERWGDIALSTKDMTATYHLAVVIDDDAQNISHCVRGQDLEASTDIHTILQQLLGLKKPLYHHHRLVKEAGRKLSKSDGDAYLRGFIDRQLSRQDIMALCRDRL